MNNEAKSCQVALVACHSTWRVCASVVCDVVVVRWGGQFIWCHFGAGSKYRAYDMCSSSRLFASFQFADSQSVGSSCNKDLKRRWNCCCSGAVCVVTLQARYIANETRKCFLLSFGPGLGLWLWLWLWSIASSIAAPSVAAVSRTFTSLCGN